MPVVSENSISIGIDLLFSLLSWTEREEEDGNGCSND